MSIRFGTLWTSARALLMGKPYSTACHMILNGSCPICGSPQDTPGHILGSCSPLANYYIARHNIAVTMIYDAIVYGKLSGCFTIMDATSRHNLTTGLSCTSFQFYGFTGTSSLVVGKFFVL